MACVVGLVCLAKSKPSFAQANYESVQLGGRTAMMGGAAVASGEDQATAFINPAGITRIPGESFSFSTFAASFKSRTIQNAMDPSGTLGLSGTSVNQMQLRILPNTFCLFLNGPPKDSFSSRSRHKYAICASATEREEFDFTRNQSQSSDGGRTRSGIAQASSMDFVRSTMALAWGLELNKNTSLGVTARVDNTILQDRTSSTTFEGSEGMGEMHSLSLNRDAWSWDTSLVIGLTANISRVVTLGASLTTPSLHLLGSYVGQSSVANSGNEPHVLVQDIGDFRYNHPGGLRLGLSFNWPRFLLEIDGSFYAPQRKLAQASFDRDITGVSSEGELADAAPRGTITERGRPVTNLAIGMEYFLDRSFSVIAGAQTDFSGLQSRTNSYIRDVLFRNRKDAMYLSVGVGKYGKTGRLLLGLRGEYASGKVLIADAAPTRPSFVALPQNEWGLSLIVSGRISFQAVRDAAARVAEPLTGGEDDKKQEEGAPP